MSRDTDTNTMDDCSEHEPTANNCASFTPTRLTKYARVYTAIALAFLATGLAMANGMGYNCGNLRQYLLHGLHALDPTFLANDWFTTQTLMHHAAFSTFIAIIGSVARLDIAFGIANAAFAAVLVICIHLIAARFYRTPIVVTAVAVFIITFSPRNMVGWTSIMQSYFQPSTVGGIGLLVGITCLIYRRYRLAGLGFFLGSLFHLHYMLWIICLAGFVVLVNLREIKIRRAIYVIAPIALAVLYHLPLMAAMRSAEQAPYAAEATRIIHEIYAPFHYSPLTWGVEPFIQFAVILAAVAVALKFVPSEQRPDRMILSILAGITGIIATGMFLTIVVPVDAVTWLFPYRIVPFLGLAAQIAVAGALACSAQTPRPNLLRTFLLWTILAVLLYVCGVSQYGLLCLGIVLVPLLAGRVARQPELSTLTIIVVLGGLLGGLFGLGVGRGGLAFAGAFVIAAVVWRLAQRSTKATTTWIRPLLWGRFVVPLVIAAFVIRVGLSRKDFFGPPPQPAEELAMYEWCRANTDRDTIFIIPPDLVGFRLGARRAVVADWKCIPVLPTDTLEWRRRLVDLTGEEIEDDHHARDGYLKMDDTRASALARQYGARYLVTYSREHRGNITHFSRAYDNAEFAVFDLQGAIQSPTVVKTAAADDGGLQP